VNDIVKAKEAMTISMEEMGLQEFDRVPDTKKVKVYISEVLLIREGFGEDWESEDWHGENAFDSMAADIEKGNPGIFICARPLWVGKLHVMKERKQWKAGLIVLCEKNNYLNGTMGRKELKVKVEGRNRYCRIWRENAGTVVCDKCLKIGHGGMKCRNKMVCRWCRKEHYTSQHKCPIVECDAAKGVNCIHCSKMCTLSDKVDHFTGYRECSVLREVRNIPPKYNQALLIKSDPISVKGVMDNSKTRFNRGNLNEKVEDQVIDNEETGDITTKPTTIRKISTSVPAMESERIVEENETTRRW